MRRTRWRGRGGVPVLLLGAACVTSIALADHEDASPTSTRTLVLRDEFAATALDERHWRTCHWWADDACTIGTNRELESYRPEQVRAGGGRLRLVAERRDVRGSDGRLYPYASGMISSGPGPGSRRPKFAFRYGRAEIRARVPAGAGLWSAFWLLPVNRESTPEIDVMEILGQRPDTVEMHVHWRSEGEARQLGRRWRQPGLRAGWHTFAIDWRPGSLAWIIDGRVRWRVRGSAVPRTRMYLVVNLAVGGAWPGAPDAATRFPSELVVDSVKVWR